MPNTPKEPKAHAVPSLSDEANRVFQSGNKRWFVSLNKARPDRPLATSGDDWFPVTRKEAGELLQGKLG
jgi:hypothetical protein